MFPSGSYLLTGSCRNGAALSENTIYRDYKDFASAGFSGLLDDKTRRDLELDRVFAETDKTKSLPGKSLLYAWFNTQCTDEHSLSDRVRLINVWENFTEADNLRKVFRKCGFQDRGSIVREIWSPVDSPEATFRFFMYIWFVLSILAFLSPLFLGSRFLFFIAMPVALVNAVIHFRWHHRIAPHYDSICYLSRLLKCGRKIRSLLPSALKSEKSTLDSLCHNTRKLGKHTLLFLNPNRVSTDLLSSILEYLRVFLLAEMLSFMILYKQISDNTGELKKLFELVGSLDASLALSDFKKKNSRISHPVIKENASGLEFTNMFHPLIPYCTANSGEFRRGVILTGSNMAGKSTFLRTLGINQVLATTIGFCFCENYRTGYYRVATSIQTVDDLTTSQSHYLAEAERLHHLWKLASSLQQSWLILVDEVLSGTNSTDRNRAVISIMKSLSSSPSIIVVTTHELEIAGKLMELYDNYHFSEEIIDRGFDFDFRLKPGIVEKSNALRILRQVGFPDDIIPETE